MVGEWETFPEGMILDTLTSTGQEPDYDAPWI
jgi:hypothetical protein